MESDANDKSEINIQIYHVNAMKFQRNEHLCDSLPDKPSFFSPALRNVHANTHQNEDTSIRFFYHCPTQPLVVIKRYSVIYIL